MPIVGDPEPWNSHAEGPLRSGPLVGEVGETEVRIWAQARDASPLTLELSGPDGATRALTVTPAAADGWCVTFHVTGLAQGAYHYSLVGARGRTPSYALRTGPSPDARKIRIAFGSCYRRFWYSREAQPIFDSIAADGAELFVMTGDNCYYVTADDPFPDAPKLPASGADYDHQTAMLLAQLRHRNNDGLRALVASVPTIAIWDDHDFGPNNSDATFAHRDDALAAFRLVWPQRMPNPTTYSSVRAGPVELFLIDDRYHRTPPDVPVPEILGAAQRAWLESALLASRAPVKVIVSGSVVLPEFIGRVTPGDWEGWKVNAPAERDALFALIERNNIRGVVFVSGDLHLGYLYHRRGAELPNARRGPDYWEIVPSPLANIPWFARVVAGDAPTWDPGVRAEIVGDNYGLLDVDLDRAGGELIVSLKDPRGAALASEPIALASLQTRPRADRLSAVTWPSGSAYLFKGDGYLRYSIGGKSDLHRADPGYPKPIAGRWPGLARDVDAGVALPDDGLAYLFSGNGYVRCRPAPGCARESPGSWRADAGYPAYITRAWTGFFSRDLDAAAAWPDGSLYFFKGAQYLRCAPGARAADPGHPRPILGDWPGLGEAFPGGIDAVIVWSPDVAFFFKDDRYARYSIAGNAGVVPGHPRPIADDWPELAAL